MIIYSEAPTRISLFGGGTDLQPYYEKYGGMVISMAINIRQKVTMYCEDEASIFSNNTFPYDGDPHFMYNILEEFKINGGHATHLISTFDGIMKAGLGSSAAAAVCLIGAINRRLSLNMGRDEIAERAWDIEVNKMNKFGGKQDQYAAVYGGLNCMLFQKDSVIVKSIDKRYAENLKKYMTLFYIGGKRESSDIQHSFQSLDKNQIETLQKMKVITAKAFSQLNCSQNLNIESIAELLNQSWRLKKESNKRVSTHNIDALYNFAVQHGAMAGKLLGAGGGGHMLFIVEPKKRKSFIEKMKSMTIEEVDFEIDYTGLNTRIL